MNYGNPFVCPLGEYHLSLVFSEKISDRYYMALYRKLLDPGLQTSSKQAMFLNLLFKSMKADLVTKRVKVIRLKYGQFTCVTNPCLMFLIYRNVHTCHCRLSSNVSCKLAATRLLHLFVVRWCCCLRYYAP